MKPSLFQLNIHNIYSNCIYHWTTRIYLQIIYPDLGISVQWVRVKKRIAQSWWNISFKFHNQVRDRLIVAPSTTITWLVCTSPIKVCPFFFCYFYGNFIELDVFLTKKGPPYIEREYFLIRFKSYPKFYYRETILKCQVNKT